jgi:hypothetical protein
VHGPLAIRFTTACAALALLGACGDAAGSATPPTVSAGPTASAAPAIAVTRSDDGCSPDNSPTDVVVTPGPAPHIAVKPQSTNSPLPDLVVRRINCAGGWVNLRNEIPADRPVLVWFWAPY